MAKITIDGKEYESDAFPESTKQLFQNLVACDQKIQQLKGEMLIAQTARASFVRVLREALAGQ